MVKVKPWSGITNVGCLYTQMSASSNLVLGRFTPALKSMKEQHTEIHTPPGPRRHQSWLAKDKQAQDSSALESADAQQFGQSAPMIPSLTALPTQCLLNTVKSKELVCCLSLLTSSWILLSSSPILQTLGHFQRLLFLSCITRRIIKALCLRHCWAIAVLDRVY